MKNVTIVGAGVVGLATAYELAERGLEVTVLDGDAAGAGASAGNAGWVTPFLAMPRAAPGAVRDAIRSFTRVEGPARMRPHAEPAFVSWVARFLRASSRGRSSRATAALQALAGHAHQHFDALVQRGVSFEQHQDGLAVVFQREENLRQFGDLVTRMRGFGYEGDVHVHRAAAVRDFDPAIARGMAGVVQLQGERHVRPETLTAGLTKAVLGHGGKLLEHDPVVRLDRRGPRWLVTTTEGRSVESDGVVVAAGFPTRDLLRPLGVRVPLEAAKGTSLTAHGEGIVPGHPLKLYEHMVACSPFGQAVRLSGTFDVGRRDAVLDRRRLSMVVRHGLRYLEDWRPTDVELEWVGHRPTTVDDLPIIGEVPGRPGLFLATGHGTLGVTLGPVTGALLAREITDPAEQPLLTPFRLTRFGRR